MRKISTKQLVIFFMLFVLASAGAVATTWLTLGRLPLGDFRGVALVASFIASLYAWALVLYRLFLHLFPLKTGEIPQDSRQEFVYHVYLLFFLILFYPVMRSGFIPVPLMRLFFQALGARMGANSYSAGIILDPIFVELGDNTLVGQFALLVPHVIEGERLAHYPICIGSNVTIGAGATILSGVTIGDGAIVSTGAVIKKGTVIGPGEIWGGVPAKWIGTRSASTTVE